jgi:hypothetical protein
VFPLLIDSTTSADPDLIGVDRVVVGMFPDDFQLSPEFFRVPSIVAIQKSHPWIVRQPDPQVACTTHPFVALMKIIDSSVAEVSDDVSRVIG